MIDELVRYQELANFLKARRARISPSQVGLSKGSRRRTSGLRREEVAQLAGIGVTWYTWLEQGRSIRVSVQVLESISRALLLDDNEKAHLFALAQQALPVEMPDRPETISPFLQHLLDNLTLSPSLVMDFRWNVLGWNRSAAVIFGDFAKMTPLERNTVWRFFTWPSYRQLFVDWEPLAKNMVARFRATSGRHIEDPKLAKFIAALKQENPDFKRWWSEYDIDGSESGIKILNHPVAGQLLFEHNAFAVAENPNLTLMIHTPQPGTDTAKKIQRLLHANKDGAIKETP
jgi:transcriptional regulator with XRE-family HTH domain